MAEVAPAAPAAPAKALQKKAASHTKREGPSVGELIVKAVSSSKERNGMSLPALKKALVTGGYDVEKNNSRVKVAVRSLVTKGTLLQTRGNGASGSFKLNKKQVVDKKPVKKAAPKVKKAVTTKKTPAKKAVVKNTLKKPVTPKAKKNLTKVKKVTVAKKPTKSPMKTKKLAAASKKVSESHKKAKAAKLEVDKPKTVKAKKAAPKK